MKRNIGDIVWLPFTKSVDTEEVCPACYGNKTITVILGNGETVKPRCNSCDTVGTTRDFVEVAKPTKVVITKITSYETYGKTEYEYIGTDGVYDALRFKENDICETEGEALLRSTELSKKRNEERALRTKNIYDVKIKELAYLIRYWFREAKKAETEAKKYKMYAGICKEKQNEKK